MADKVHEYDAQTEITRAGRTVLIEETQDLLVEPPRHRPSRCEMDVSDPNGSLRRTRGAGDPTFCDRTSSTRARAMRLHSHLPPLRPQLLRRRHIHLERIGVDHHAVELGRRRH